MPATSSGSFGSAAANTYSVAHYFTITNTGTTALNLTGTPKVALSGTNAADFSIALQPVSPVAATTGILQVLSREEFQRAVHIIDQHQKALHLAELHYGQGA